MSATSALEYTGERIVPGATPLNAFCESQMRYVFARQYARGKSILDVACGTGIGTEFLRKQGAKSCCGVDLDQDSISVAGAKWPACEFTVSDAAALPFADSSFDVVVSFETIEHLPNPRQFVTECYRLVKPGGVVLCSTPNAALWRWVVEQNPFHLHAFFPDQFRDLLLQSFGNCEMFGQCFVNFPRYLLRRLGAIGLERLRLRAPLRRLFPWTPGPYCTEQEFNADACCPDYEVLPLRRQSWRQPLFLVAVVNKNSDEKLIGCEG